MGERDRIARFFAPLTAAEPGGFNLTDDAAMLVPPAGHMLVITTDSVIESIHVLPHATAQQYAHKLMRRNLSDLAAMGAMPWRYTLNVHTPKGLDDDWFAAFAAALVDEQAHFNLTLVGGDSTSGGSMIHTTMTCFGLSDGAPLRRNGAQVGDDLYVSGNIGGAAYALALLQQNQPVSESLAARYHHPEPRLALGQMLRSIASSALDISDGLLTDIAQLCSTSDVGATITRSAIPCDPALLACIAQDGAAWRFALNGGDDYELCFTAARQHREAIAHIAQALALPLTRIGEITPHRDVVLMDEDGHRLPITQQGWEHV